MGWPLFFAQFELEDSKIPPAPLDGGIFV